MPAWSPRPRRRRPGTFTRRLALDLAIAVLVLLGFGALLTGEAWHELLGSLLVGLILLHNVLHWRWYGGLVRGRYSPFRLFDAVLKIVLVLDVILLTVSGVAASAGILRFLHLSMHPWSPHVHALASYWFLVLMSLHLGLRWPVVTAMIWHHPSPGVGRRRLRAIGLGLLAVALLASGAYAAVDRRFVAKLWGHYLIEYWNRLHLNAFQVMVDYGAISAMLVVVVFHTVRMVRRRSA